MHVVQGIGAGAELANEPGAVVLPVAEEMGDRTLSLPLYPTLSADHQDRVVEAVADAWSALAVRRG